MIEEKIKKDLVKAQKDRDALRVLTLRFLLSEIHNREIEKQGKLSCEDVISVLQNQVKKRKESIEAFKKGGRQDLVTKEEEELKLLSKYLPQMLSEEEIGKIADEVIGEMGASSPSDFGKVMGQVMGELKGRVDGAQVSKLVKDKLVKA